MLAKVATFFVIFIYVTQTSYKSNNKETLYKKYCLFFFYHHSIFSLSFQRNTFSWFRFFLGKQTFQIAKSAVVNFCCFQSLFSSFFFFFSLFRQKSCFLNDYFTRYCLTLAISKIRQSALFFFLPWKQTFLWYLNLTLFF